MPHQKDFARRAHGHFPAGIILFLSSFLLLLSCSPYTKLGRLAIDGSLEAIKAEVNNGADVNEQNESGVTALMLACDKGRADITEYLLSKGAKTGIKEKFGNTALHYAANGNHIECASQLVSAGADINARNYGRATPLATCAYFGKADMARYLITKGANVNVKGSGKLTPLLMSVMNPLGADSATVSALVENGANIEANDSARILTALAWAALNEHGAGAVRILLDAGANICVMDRDKRTILELIGKKINGQFWGGAAQSFNSGGGFLANLIVAPIAGAINAGVVRANLQPNIKMLEAAGAPEQTENVKDCLSAHPPKTPQPVQPVQRPQSLNTDSASIDSSHAAASPVRPDTSAACYPPCSPGYLCYKGKCVEKCNPPCPDQYTCSDEGECVPSETQAPEITKKVVDSRLAVKQGIIVSIKNTSGEICVDDSSYGIRKDLYLNLPEGKHGIMLKKQGYFTEFRKQEVKANNVEELSLRLSRFKFDFHFSASPSFLFLHSSPEFALIGISAGLGIPKHSFGLTVSLVPSYFTIDTLRHGDTTEIGGDSTRNSVGAGVYYDYTFFDGKVVKISAGVAAGYWKMNFIQDQQMTRQTEVHSGQVFLIPRLSMRFCFRKFYAAIGADVPLGSIIAIAPDFGAGVMF